MSASIILLVLSLVGGVMGSNNFTTVNDSATLTAMGNVCSGAPISNLKMCNNTCYSCTESNSYKCSTCMSGFKFSIGNCLLSNEYFYNYTIYNYLNSQSEIPMTSDLAKFIYGDTKTSIGGDKVVEVCKKNTYRMFMAGPFKTTDVVGLNYKLTDNIDGIQIKFNLMSFVSEIRIWIDINEYNIFNSRFFIYQDLTGQYGKRPNNTGPNYVYINALNTSNVGRFVSSVNTGMQRLTSNDIAIRIYVTTDDTGYSWAFSDFVVIQRVQPARNESPYPVEQSTMVINWYIVLIIVVVALIILFVIYKVIRCIATNQTTAGEAMDSAANLAHAAGDANLKASDVVNAINPVVNLLGAAGTCLIIKLEAFKRKWGFKIELAIISQPMSSIASSTRLSRPARSSIKKPALLKVDEVRVISMPGYLNTLHWVFKYYDRRQKLVQIKAKESHNSLYILIVAFFECFGQHLDYFIYKYDDSC